MRYSYKENSKLNNEEYTDMLDKLSTAEIASKERRREHEDVIRIVEGLEKEREKLRVGCLRLNMLVEKVNKILPVG